MLTEKESKMNSYFWASNLERMLMCGLKNSNVHISDTYFPLGKALITYFYIIISHCTTMSHTTHGTESPPLK